MRTSSLLLAAALAVVGCGDDTGGNGGSGAGSGNSTTATGGDTSSPTSTGSSPTSTGAGEGGGSTGTTTGIGGSDATTGGVGGFEPADTVQQACENLNQVFDAAAAQLGCSSTPGNCSAPVDACEPELLALMNCLVAEVDAEDCTCTGGGEGGAGDGSETLSCDGVASGECPDQNAAYADCMGF